MKLAGVIYLHDIHLRRRTRESIRSQIVFQEFCGPNAYSSVILGTTQWDTLPASAIPQALEREEDLRAHWREMLDNGSRLFRLDDNQPWSMIKAVDPLSNKEGVVLEHELVNLKKTIPQIKAFQRSKQSLEEFLCKLDKRDSLHQVLTKRMQDFFRL